MVAQSYFYSIELYNQVYLISVILFSFNINGSCIVKGTVTCFKVTKSGMSTILAVASALRL